MTNTKLTRTRLFIVTGNSTKIIFSPVAFSDALAYMYIEIN